MRTTPVPSGRVRRSEPEKQGKTKDLEEAFCACRGKTSERGGVSWRMSNSPRHTSPSQS